MGENKKSKKNLLRKRCPMCRRETYLRMTEAEMIQFGKYYYDGGLIQDRLPHMGVLEREFLVTGFCPDCQERIFGTKHDRSNFVFMENDGDDRAKLLSDLGIENIYFIDDKGYVVQEE